MSEAEKAQIVAGTCTGAAAGHEPCARPCGIWPCGADEPALNAARNVERLRNRLQHLIDSPIGNRCVTCGHADGSHNSLGYCQVRSRSSECTCEVGTSIASTASIILRDLPDLLASVASPPASEGGDDRG